MMSTIQQQRDSLAGTRECLAMWGEWQSSIQVARLSFSTKSNFVTSFGGVSEYSSDEAECVERVLVKLKNKFPLLYKIIEQKYRFESTDEQGADFLRISVGQFRTKRLNAEYFVDGKLSEELNSFKKSA